MDWQMIGMVGAAVIASLMGLATAFELGILLTRERVRRVTRGKN